MEGQVQLRRVAPLLVLVALAAAPAARAESTHLEAGCGFTGFYDYDPAIDVTPSPGQIRVRLEGFCDGRLNGRKIEREPVTLTAAASGLTSCAHNDARTTDARMRFRNGTVSPLDDEVLPVTVTVTGPLNYVTIELRGHTSGRGTISPNRDYTSRPEFQWSCSRLDGGDGIHRLEVVSAMATASLVSAAPPREELRGGLWAPARQRRASVMRTGVPARLSAAAPVEALVRAFMRGQVVWERTLRIDKPLGGEIDFQVPLGQRGQPLPAGAASVTLVAQMRHASGAAATARSTVRLTRPGRAIAPRRRLAPPAGDYTTALVSRVGSSGPVADRGVRRPLAGLAISGDGRRIVFLSEARNLPGSEGTLTALLYVKDLPSGEVTLASVDAFGMPVPGSWPRMSRNGRHICWYMWGGEGSNVRNLGRPTGTIYVRDLHEGRTRTIPGPAIGQDYKHPFATQDWNEPTCDVSENGRTVVYATTESYDQRDTDDDADVYAYDPATNRRRLVSVDGPDGAPGPLGPARYPEMTPDGRYVVFVAYDGVVLGQPPLPVANASPRVFRYDLATGELLLLSRPDGCKTHPPHGDGRWPVISDDGRFVAFTSGSSLDPETPIPYSESGYRAIAIYVRDVDACDTHMVSRSSGMNGAPARDLCDHSSISADGTLVAFDCWADNISAEVPQGSQHPDVFVRAWKTGRTALISRTAGLFGEAANGRSVYPVIAGDGSRVAFMSDADNLVAERTPGNSTSYYRDIVGTRGLLAADLPGPPSIFDLLYRRGRSAGGDRNTGKLVFSVSEAAELTVRIDGIGPNPTRHSWEMAAEEGTLAWPLELRPGRYQVTVAARDLGERRSEHSATFEVPITS